jgi:ubiquinone/menaquinone biosynthesis C-methylase UbiE
MTPSASMTQYIIRGGVEGKARLGVVARAFRTTTLDWLERSGLTTGLSCLDVGCGGGHVTLDMARIAGPTGRVTGVDLDPVKLELAAHDAAAQGLTNVSFTTMDARDWQPDEPCDLVYARFLLTHLREPVEMLRRMSSWAKPGGAIVVEDIDIAGCFAYPDSPAMERQIALYSAAAVRRGCDPRIGCRLRTLFVEGGLRDVTDRLVQPVSADGEGKFIHSITTRAIEAALIAEGLATAEEVDRLVADLEALAHDPQTLLGFPRVFQAAGRRP